MPHRILKGSPIHQRKRPEGARPPYEVGTRKLFTIQQVHDQLLQMSRGPFQEILALMLGSHPSEQDLIAFASRNPDKWATAVNLLSKLSGYHEQLEVNHNIYAQVLHMSDMDLEHQLRAVNNKIGDSHLVDPAILETPYKHIDEPDRAQRRISKYSK